MVFYRGGGPQYKPREIMNASQYICNDFLICFPELNIFDRQVFTSMSSDLLLHFYYGQGKMPVPGGAWSFSVLDNQALIFNDNLLPLIILSVQAMATRAETTIDSFFY